MSAPFDPFDPETWRVETSGTEAGQQQIARERAAVLISHPLIYILHTLFDLGLLGEGRTFEIPVTTPTQTITVTIAVEPNTEGM